MDETKRKYGDLVYYEGKKPTQLPDRPVTEETAYIGGYYGTENKTDHSSN